MRTLLALSLAVLSACGGGPRSELADARATWAENGADTYAFVVMRSCECLDVAPVGVSVVDGEVAEARRRDATAEVVLEPSEYQPWFTVDGLFDLAEQAIDEADDVTITYDETLGYPSRIFIDWMSNAIDDEQTFDADEVLFDE